MDSDFDECPEYQRPNWDPNLGVKLIEDPSGTRTQFSIQYDRPNQSASDISGRMKRDLLIAFSERGLLPSEAAYNVFRRMISEQGKRIATSFFNVVSKDDWNAVNQLLHRKTLFAEIQRILGIGAYLTEFAIDPVPIDARFRRQFIELGTLANIIGATYDMFVDSGKCDPDVVLSKISLNRALSRLDGLKLHPPYTSASQKIVSEMMGQYFRLLRRFSDSSNVRLVRDLLRADVLRLLDAEAKTLSKERYNEQDVRDKSALLFVLMGLPAWLALDRVEPNQVINHRRWLYNIGDLLGWVDDVADLQSDIKYAQPNRIAIWLYQKNKGIYQIIQHVLEMAGAIMDEWEQNSHTRGSRCQGLALSGTVLSWLGGPGDFTQSQPWTS